jgi:hypothetical protein
MPSVHCIGFVATTASNGSIFRILCPILPDECERRAEPAQPKTSRIEFLCPEFCAGQKFVQRPG